MKTTYRSIKKEKINVINIDNIQYEQIKVKEQDNNFFKLWLYDYKKISDKKIALLFYLVNNMNNKNLILINMQELAEIFKVTRQTISNYLKGYKKDNHLKIKNQIVFINPERYYKGNAYFRQYRISDYKGNKFTND